MTPIDRVRFLASGVHHPEGIAYDGRSLICGGSEGQLHRVNPETGSVEVFARQEGFLLGLAVDAAGAVYACNLGRSLVSRTTPEGETSIYTEGTAAYPLRTPNYAVFDEDGYLYVSDSGSWGDADGDVIVVSPEGRTQLGSAEVTQYPNGLAINPAGEHLYVVETTLPGVTRLPLLGNGQLGPREEVVRMPKTVPDGLAFCADGRLLISCYRPDAIMIWDGGGLATLVADWTGQRLIAPTNLCFFGEGLERLAAVTFTASVVMEVLGPPLGARVARPRIVSAA